ncbi:hypothetical protein MPTK1_3g16840 [Marchantia polymorpha subsp. ruderalis]|uniref:Uncharacterized protein n=2 Tax=Marchantia polymorpha TaxID=3197 RepID=A0AAF6B1L7_MARPO|nr:hypothetical protein MARPO_0039s0111 [Marchantia polymorpha]BBN05901.1 hypothetical protein Mp_3g16840 [Marchantia polymorpha subsp. ruderalis]|eukprot:PTQ40624.1 hypothetical protein MARPO_0039s0111 [Marchantia polymorpha]
MTHYRYETVLLRLRAVNVKPTCLQQRMNAASTQHFSIAEASDGRTTVGFIRDEANTETVKLQVSLVEFSNNKKWG